MQRMQYIPDDHFTRPVHVDIGFRHLVSEGSAGSRRMKETHASRAGETPIFKGRKASIARPACSVDSLVLGEYELRVQS